MIKKCELCGKNINAQGKDKWCKKHIPPRMTGRDMVRFLVRRRDNFTCQDCGLVKIKIENKKGKRRSLDVHHLNGLCGKKSRGYDKVSEIDNLITLCHKCHFNRPEHKCKSLEYSLLKRK